MGMIGWIIFTLTVNSIFYDSKNPVTYEVVTVNHLIGLVLIVIAFRFKKRAVGVGILSAITLFVIVPFLLISLGVFSGDAVFLGTTLLEVGCIPPLFYYPFPVALFSTC